MSRIIYHKNVVVSIIFLLYPCTAFAFENGTKDTIDALLSNLNSPLKLTLMTCWDAETTLNFARYITPKFQLRILNGSTETKSNIFERHYEVVVLDLDCGNTLQILSKISRHMFNFYKIIVVDRDDCNVDDISIINSNIKQLFRDLPILPMSQIFYICKDSVKNNFVIKQVYRMGLNEPLVVEQFAYYDGKQYESTVTMTSAIRRRNIQGFQLTASMVILNNSSLNHLDDYREIHIDAISKLCYQLTNHLVRFVNGTVKYSIVPTWGYKNQSTGKWNGMVGEILSNEADIGATALFFTAERVSMMEYITRPSSAHGGFIFRKPKLSYTSNIYVLPFERLLWICLLLLVVVIAICLGGAVSFEAKAFPNSAENKFSVGDVLLIVYGAICQQGTTATPQSVTGRIIIGIAFIILMFLYVSYSANIVALLQSPSNQINTLQDLYESKLDASVEDTVYNRYYFPRETETLRKKFFKEKLLNKDGKPNFDVLQNGIKKVRQGQYAFYTEYSSAYKIISETFHDDEKCGLQGVSFFQMKIEPWYAIQKNSSYKEILKIGMMRIQEHGLQNKENLRYYLTKPKCAGGGGGNFVSASLIDTGPALLILPYGLVITLVVFAFELLVGHLNFIRSKLSLIRNRMFSNGLLPTF